VAGLAEVGSKDDLQIFEQFVNSAGSNVIIACLSAFNKFDPAKAKDLSLKLLIHPAKRIRDKAVDILAKSCDLNIFEYVRAIYISSSYEIKRTILKFYSRNGEWYVLGDILIAVTDEDTSIQNIGWQMLKSWRDKDVNLFTTPPKLKLKEQIAYINT